MHLLPHMDSTSASKPFKLGDRSTSDIVVHLKNCRGRPERIYTHSCILIKKSKFFADQLSSPPSKSCIEIKCSEYNYDDYFTLLKLLYLPSETILDDLDSVKSTIGILHVAVTLGCEEVTKQCIQYLEAVPWEDKEEEEILKAVSKLGVVAMPILARIQPVDVVATKNVFLSAIRFAMSIGEPCPPFGDELKTSAQEQVEYMLGTDEDTPLVVADDEVKSAVRTGLSKVCSSFERELLEFDLTSESTDDDDDILRTLSDLEWMCNILPKMDMMKEFVSKWADISGKILLVVEDKKLDSIMWGLKVKLVEVTGKVLEAVGYGNVIVPAQSRLYLLKTWLPFIRKIKAVVDAKLLEDSSFKYKMDQEVCQSIEGAMVSLVLALPSNDQADILSEWIKSEHVKYPDLSEAFEVWCYRSKSAKRRLVEGSDRVGEATVSL